MLSRFYATVLQITIGTTLLLVNIPKVGASQIETSRDVPICQNESLLQTVSSRQQGKLCKAPESSETESSDKNPINKSAENSDRESDGALDNSEGSRADDETTGSSTNDASKDPGNSIEQQNIPSSQDSHDFNLHLELNLGGNREAPQSNTTDLTAPEPIQPEAPLAKPSQNSSTNNEQLNPPQSASPKQKKPHLMRTDKQKSLDQNNKGKEHINRDHPPQQPKNKRSSDQPSNTLNFGKQRSDRTVGNFLNRNSQKHSAQFHPSVNRLRNPVRPTRIFRSPFHGHIR
jgi:hypothetical protein